MMAQQVPRVNYSALEGRWYVTHDGEIDWFDCEDDAFVFAIEAHLASSRTTALAAKEAELAAVKALLSEARRLLPLLDNPEAGSTTDLLCYRIDAALSEQQP